MTNEAENYKRMRSGVMDEVKRIFKPEFLNRVDETIVFHALTKEHMGQIVDIMLDTLCKRTRSQTNICLEVDETAKTFLVGKGYDEKYGARPLRRTLQSEIEDRLAEEILDGRIGDGDTVFVTCGEDKLLFRRKETCQS